MNHHCCKLNYFRSTLMSDRPLHSPPLRVTFPIPLLFLIGILTLLWAMPLHAGKPTAPAAPSNLSAVAVSSSQITLAWTDNSNNESGFRIQRAPTSGGPWAQIVTTGAGVVSFSNSGLTAGTACCYRVCAYNSRGDSAYGNVASAVTQAAACTYSISPTSSSVGASSGSGYVSVTAGTGCGWTATSSASWITITSLLGLLWMAPTPSALMESITW